MIHCKHPKQNGGRKQHFETTTFPNKFLLFTDVTSLERLCEVAGVPDVGLVGNSTYSQKGVMSLSCGRELRCDTVYPARTESAFPQRVSRMRLHFAHSFVSRLLEGCVVNSMSLEKTSQAINPDTHRCLYPPPPSLKATRTFEEAVKELQSSFLKSDKLNQPAHLLVTYA